MLQNVTQFYILLNHLQHITKADITYGHHCGYISPIPFLEFNDILSEGDFKSFIEAVSNDIVNWDTIKSVMVNGGVTYSDQQILGTTEAVEVQEINQSKFISGSNLCINLTKPSRVYPFYNPPKARGEDTFLSTCLSDRTVLRVPCYTFHDGFSTYNHLLAGVLPVRLKFIKADNAKIVTRFYKACIGWIRYKPLLLYITKPDSYDEDIKKMRQQLIDVLPQICEFFGTQDFMSIIKELDRYKKNVKTHHAAFLQTQKIWADIMAHFDTLVDPK